MTFDEWVDGYFKGESHLEYSGNIEAMRSAWDAALRTRPEEAKGIVIPLALARELDKVCLSCCAWSNRAAESGDALGDLIANYLEAHPEERAPQPQEGK